MPILRLAGLSIFTTALLVLAGLPAGAQHVYRCVDESGTTVFSDRPCSASPSERVDATPHQGHATSHPGRQHGFSAEPLVGNRSTSLPQQSSGARSPAVGANRSPSANDPQISSLLRERNRLVARMRSRGAPASEQAQLLQRVESVESEIASHGFDMRQHRYSSGAQIRDSQVIQSAKDRVAAWEQSKDAAELVPPHPPPPVWNGPNDERTTRRIYDFQTNRYLHPAGRNAIDHSTGTIWRRTRDGFKNPVTGEEIEDPYRSPPAFRPVP